MIDLTEELPMHAYRGIYEFLYRTAIIVRLFICIPFDYKLAYNISAIISRNCG